MSEQLTHEKIVEIITIFELDRNVILKDMVANGDERGNKNRKVRMLESLTQQMVSYGALKKADVPVVEPTPEVVPE